MFTKLGNYEIYKKENLTIVIYEKNSQYSFYIQKRNVTWHPVRSWAKINECKEHSIKYLNEL